MKKIIYTSILVCVLALSAGAQTSYENIPVNPDYFNAFIEWQMEKYNIPGVQIGILHEGALAWKNNYGWSYIEQQIPVDDSTLFMLGSISKSISGTAIMQMVKKGLIDLNGDINQYLPFQVVNPYYPSSIITPYMLMTHTSSINSQYFIYYGFNLVGDPEVTLQEFCYNYLNEAGQYYYPENYYATPPGTDAIYSNVGAALAGYLVEAVYQNGFNLYCNDSIFARLDMNRTRWFLAETDTMEVAMPYLYNNGNPIPIGHQVHPIYPAGWLKSNVSEFANYVSMFANNGVYENQQILDSAMVSLMTTVLDTVDVYGDLIPYGLFWLYTPLYDTWGHDGGADGCSTIMFYQKEQEWGGIILINTDLWDPQPVLMERLREVMHRYARTFSEFYVSSIETSEPNGNGILEPNELVELVIGVKNIFMNAVENVEVTLRCNDPCFQLLDTVASLGDMASGEIATNQDQPFQFQVMNFQNPHPVDMELEFHYNNKIDIVHFRLFAGMAEVLLVKDERDVFNSQRFYLDVLDSLGYITHYWDIDVNGNPDSTFLKYFPAVVWYTGSDQGNTISEDNQNALIAYLNNGGRLFVTGQSISDEIGNTVFMNDYLHAGDGGNTNMYLVQGIAGDILSDGMFFHLNAGNSLNNQYSLSIITPVNGGTGCFKYGYGSSMAGVRFDDDIYRTVFLGFGFEGIDSTAHRYELMQRIMQYFDVYVGENEFLSAVNDLSEIKLMPNPASDRITINYTLSAQQDITIRVFDLAGREIITETRMKEQPGNRIVTLQLDRLAEGVYMVWIKGQQQRKTVKLVVVK